MSPSLYVKYGYKNISLNTGFGSLEDTRLNGYIFGIQDINANLLGSCKKRLTIKGSSTLKWGIRPGGNCKNGCVFLETNSVLLGFDDGEIENKKTQIYVIKSNIRKNLELGKTEFPCILIESGDERHFGNELIIEDECDIIYDLDNYHELGGKVRMQTDSEVRFVIGDFNVS